MQYILTKDKLNEIHEKYKTQIKELKDQLLQTCILAANNISVEYLSNKIIWGCILNMSSNNNRPRYCDAYPVQEQCPYEYKQWSK